MIPYDPASPPPALDRAHAPRPLRGKKKIHGSSFAAQLTAPQRDELFDALAEGLSLNQAAVKIRNWMQANQEAGLNGASPRSIKLSEITTINKWYKATAAEHRFEMANAVALIAQAHCPPDLKEQTRRALHHARFLATYEGLSVADIALLEKVDIAREKVARDDILQHCRLLYDRARFLAKRWQSGEDSDELDRQIDPLLAEIEQIQSALQSSAPPAAPTMAATET